MDNIGDENSTYSDSSNDSDSSSSGKDVNVQWWGFRLQIGRLMHVLLNPVHYMIINLHVYNSACVYRFRHAYIYIYNYNYNYMGQFLRNLPIFYNIIKL